MILNRSTMRFITAALLVAPILPLGWIAITGRSSGAPSAACATGASCATCVLDNCGSLATGWTLRYDGGVTLTRCVEYDHIVPGHCASIGFDMYSVLDGSTTVATCMKSTCRSDTVYNSRQCDNPLVL